MHTDQAETAHREAGLHTLEAVSQNGVGTQTAPIPAHLDGGLPPKVQKAHIRKRLGDIDLAIVQLENEKRDLRGLHGSIK